MVGRSRLRTGSTTLRVLNRPTATDASSGVYEKYGLGEITVMSHAFVSIESSIREAAHPLPRTSNRGRCAVMMRRLTRIQ